MTPPPPSLPRPAGAVPQALLLRKCAAYVTRILSCFGLVAGADGLGFGDATALGGAGGADRVHDVLDAFAAFR